MSFKHSLLAACFFSLKKYPEVVTKHEGTKAIGSAHEVQYGLLMKLIKLFFSFKPSNNNYQARYSYILKLFFSALL